MIDQRPSVSESALEAEHVLIAVPDTEDGKEVTRYFVSEEAADAAFPGRIRETSDLAGIWSDLDWDAMEEALDRIRHESVPTPPIDL